MRGINKVLIFGRMGHEPELKKTANGRAFIEISVATNRPIKKGDGWEEKADWHRIRFWEKEAELCEKMLRRGSPVAIEGQLRTDTWIDSEGQKRSKTFVHGDRLHLIPFRNELKPNLKQIA